MKTVRLAVAGFAVLALCGCGTITQDWVAGMAQDWAQQNGWVSAPTKDGPRVWIPPAKASVYKRAVEAKRVAFEKELATSKFPALADPTVYVDPSWGLAPRDLSRNVYPYRSGIAWGVDNVGIPGLISVGVYKGAESLTAGGGSSRGHETTITINQGDNSSASASTQVQTGRSGSYREGDVNPK